MAGTSTTRGAPPPMAAGGTTGQVLTKASNTSYDTEWTTVGGGGGGTVTDVTASAPLSSTGGATPDISIGGGTAGQVLTSNGASAPTFEDLPAPPTVPDASDATPQGIGTAAPGISADYSRADHVHAGTVTALTDRYEELPSQTFSEFAHASLISASPTRDIQTAIDATPVGPACQVIVGPGSYGGATVTIPAGRNNISIIGPSAGDLGGTIATLSSSRALTIGNNAVRVRVVSLQIEGLTTVSTTGSGVHRFEQCQLLGGLTIGAISATIYVVGCEVGAVTIPAGFTGVVLFDRCSFLSSITNNATAPLTRCFISDSAGGIAAPTTAATINGRWQVGTSTTFYAGGSALLGAPLTAINSLTPAADRIAYYTSASAGAMTALTTFGRSLIDDVDAAAARTTLGLGTAATSAATAFQAADATLTALAGVTTAANKLAYFTGVDTAAATDITTAGREILSTATSGTNGQVLTSSGGGAPTWTTVSGGGGGLPTTQAWTTEWVAASGGATISASGFTLQNLTSAGLQQDSAGNWYEALTSTAAVGRVIHSTLAPSTTTPWEMELDIACSLFDGSVGVEADEGGTGKRSRLVYQAASSQWEQSASAAITGLFDIENDDRVIMTMRSRPGGMRTYFVDGASVGGSRYSADAATQGTARYCWLNGGATATTRTYRVYAIRLLHNAVATAPPYARIIATPVQP